MKYLNIKNDGLHGINSDAILSNLGFCMASTTDEDFYNNMYKIGFDLSKIILNDLTNEEFNKILITSLKNSQEMDCGCVKNEYEINSCYVEYIAEMISDFKLYRKRELNIINKITAKKNIVKFYTNYFFILSKSANYKNITLGNSSKEFGFLLDEVIHYSLPNTICNKNKKG